MGEETERDVMWRYNIDTDSFTTLSSLPNTEDEHSCFWMNGDIVVVEDHDMYVYTVSGNTWTELDNVINVSHQEGIVAPYP